MAKGWFFSYYCVAQTSCCCGAAGTMLLQAWFQALPAHIQLFLKMDMFFPSDLNSKLKCSSLSPLVTTVVKCASSCCLFQNTYWRSHHCWFPFVIKTKDSGHAKVFLSLLKDSKPTLEIVPPSAGLARSDPQSSLQVDFKPWTLSR